MENLAGLEKELIQQQLKSGLACYSELPRYISFNKEWLLVSLVLGVGFWVFSFFFLFLQYNVWIAVKSSFKGFIRPRTERLNLRGLKIAFQNFNVLCLFKVMQL